MAQAAQGGRLDLMILELLPNPERSMISVSNMDSLMKKHFWCPRHPGKGESPFAALPVENPPRV